MNSFSKPVDFREKRSEYGTNLSLWISMTFLFERLY